MGEYSELRENETGGALNGSERDQCRRRHEDRKQAVYFAAIGGVAALLCKKIVKAEVIAYEDLGTEVIRRLVVKDFPVIVVNDIYGNDLYRQGKEQYRIAM